MVKVDCRAGSAIFSSTFSVLYFLARKKFAASPEEAFFIALDRQEAILSHGVEGRTLPPH
jgi:hypothetical protein